MHTQQPPVHSKPPTKTTATGAGARPDGADSERDRQRDRRPRAPDPSKKVVKGKDDLHSAINAAAVNDQLPLQTPRSIGLVTDTASIAGADRETSSPLDNSSPSPTSMSSSKVAPRVERGTILAHRTASIDSTVSSISSVSASTTPRPNGTNAYRVSHDTAEDAASLIAAAGSAEAALHKVLSEKQQAASHNAQLWRLVEKQRTMILGLNRDLEKSLKEKERYRRKLKENAAQSTSAPAQVSATAVDNETESRETSLSPAGDVSMRESLDARKTTSEVLYSFPAVAKRSDTPQDASFLGPSSSKLPTTPQSASSASAGSRENDREATTGATSNDNSLPQRAPAGTGPVKQPLHIPTNSQTGGQKSSPTSPYQATTSPSAQSFSSPKTRKAPPTPLKLNPPKPEINVTNNIIDASDSEYEDDPESARSDYLERGRRKTREEDDRQREIQAQQEEEQRSRSKKEKHSKSKAPVEKMDIPAVAPATVAPDAPRNQAAMFQPTADPAEIIRNRAVSDATQMLRNNIAPSLMSPGLPMSPRPGDRPPNSPMPRAPNTIANSIPMSPKAGMPAGLPLSPRAPRHAIPLPPQTPVSMMSPHLDRAKAYHQQMQPHPHSLQAATEGLKPPSDERSPERERLSTSSDPSIFTPGEVYRGFVTEQYPGLLLPPNALPSIFVKTASSRMRPSRASFIAPKMADENPVFTLSVHERSDGKQLWQVEKTFAALASLDQQVKSMCSIRERLPEKALFAGHAPAKIDARRMALNHYLDRMLDAITEERAAMVVCKFLSTDAVGDSGDYFGSLSGSRPDSPVAQLRPNRAGYLTKRGKNFGGWKARYFVLDGPNLKYFEGPGGAHMGSIKLQNAQIGKQSSNANQNNNEDEDNQFRHAFLILEPKKKDSSSLVRHVLCAESDEERDAWVDALLQYVDFKDDDDLARQAQVLKTEVPRSPRPQKSMSDLSKGTGSTSSTHTRSVDQVRAVNYSETVAGDAPVMGQAPLSPRLGTQTPSPPYDQLTNASEQQYPTISAPTNLQVIQNTGDWGMRPPPTPGSRDKKRSVFQLPFTRGRSSSDIQPGDKVASSGPAPPDRPYGSKAIFGVPLAEAVAAAQPADVSTELPAVVYRCIEYLTYRNAIAEEGIFRLSGSNTVIRSLKDRFNNEGDVNLITDDTYYDIHAVASLLKLYLRELPASILTRDLHLDFLHTLDIAGNDKVAALNALVNRLPRPNRALLEALSAFMLLIVNNVGVNKMSVRNRESHIWSVSALTWLISFTVGVVFSPTLNVPGPLISLFVEEQHRIFGESFEESDSPTSDPQPSQSQSSDLRSPRKQMFSPDLPTPAYNQTTFHSENDTGMVPVNNPSYGNYQMAPQGDGGFASLNDALRSPTIYTTTGTGAPTPREMKSKRRESGMLGVGITAPHKKTSMSRLREEEGASF